jgi:hypothetical protein
MPRLLLFNDIVAHYIVSTCTVPPAYCAREVMWVSNARSITCQCRRNLKDRIDACGPARARLYRIAPGPGGHPYM